MTWWYWSLEPLLARVRAAADRTHQSLAPVCRRIAKKHDITLAGDVSA